MAGPEVSSIWRFHGEATPNRFMFGGSNFLQFTKKRKKKKCLINSPSSVKYLDGFLFLMRSV